MLGTGGGGAGGARALEAGLALLAILGGPVKSTRISIVVAKVIGLLLVWSYSYVLLGFAGNGAARLALQEVLALGLLLPPLDLIITISERINSRRLGPRLA